MHMLFKIVPLALAASAWEAASAAQDSSGTCTDDTCPDSSSLLQHRHAGRAKSKAQLKAESKYRRSVLQRAMPEPGMDFKEPPEVRSPVTLKLTTMRMCGPEPNKDGETLCWYTRVYASDGIPPALPGPTIITHPGERLIIKVENNLEKPNPSCVDTELARAKGLLTFFGYNMLTANGFCHVNATNVHTHGLHVTPKPGGDDVFEVINPGKTGTTDMTLPEYHMPGMHWYHPHRHHATSVQAGGGLHGALRIPDPKGSLPTEIENMKNSVMVLSLVDMKYYLHVNGIFGQSSMEAFALGHLWKDQNGDYVNQDTQFLFVNGQFKPKFPMESGKWYRFQMIYAAVELALQIFPHFSKNAECEVRLLAKDGVFLNQAPRVIDRVLLASGNRADIAMRCSCKRGKSHCSSHLMSSATVPEVGDWGQGPDENKTMKEKIVETLEEFLEGHDHADSGFFQYVMSEVLNQEIMTLDITAPVSDPEPELPVFVVNRPCYLVDLRGVDVPKKQQGRIEMMDPPNWVIKWSNKMDGGWSYGTPMRNEHTQPPLTKLQLGAVQEFYIRGPERKGLVFDNNYTGLSLHPFHMHVMPYQLTSLSEPTSDYFQVGDWQDTFLHGSGQAIVKTQTDIYAGKWIMHCHLLDHEDMGMMAYFKVKGKEGSWWKGAREVDPTCYRDKSGVGYKLVETTRGAAAPAAPEWVLSEPASDCLWACNNKGGCSSKWPGDEAQMKSAMASAGAACKSWNKAETEDAPTINKDTGECSFLPASGMLARKRCGVSAGSNSTQRLCSCRGIAV